MWKCRKCGNVIFRKDDIVRRNIILNENGNIKSYKKPAELIERIICNECGNYSDSIEDLADWINDGPDELDCIG